MSSTPDNIIPLPVAHAATSVLEEDLFSGRFSPAQALERLRARLLDLTRQNRLLRFIHPKRRSFQFVNVDIEASFRRLANGDQCALLPVPEPHRTDYAPGPRPEAREWAKEHHRWDVNVDLAPPRGDLPATGRSGHALYVALYAPDLDRSTRTIARDANTAIEETGVNVLHLIFGFLEFFDSEDSEKPFCAPLVAMPAKLTRQSVDPRSGFYRYDISYTGDDYSENLTLREKLWNDFHIRLPEFSEDEGVEGYLERLRTLVHTRPRWRVRRQMSLGLLSFAKLALWNDLDLVEWPQFAEHHVIKALFQGNTAELGDPLEDHDPQTHSSYTELIFDSDASQNRAIIDVLNGRNLVIDGPPGTGKSQTIVNVIASAMAAGKTVLFVSEKLAALEVVQRRLAKARLAPFLLELHSNKAQKKQLLENLDARMRARFDSPADYRGKLATFKKRHAELQQYAKLLNSVTGNNLNKTVFEIYWAAERRRRALGELAPQVEAMELPSATEMTAESLAESASTMQSLAGHFDAVGDFGPAHPWIGYESDRLAAGDDLQIAELLRRHLGTAKALDSATAQLASVVGLEASALSRSAVVEIAVAVKKLPSPSQAVNEELLAIFYPPNDSAGASTGPTVTHLISALKDLRRLRAAAATCQLDPVDATPSRLQEAREAADVLRKFLGPGRILENAKALARSLYELGRRAEMALGAWLGSARLAGLSFAGTNADVNALCAVSRVAQAAPLGHLAWRHTGMASGNATGILAELRTEHGRLIAERGKLEQDFYFDSEPPLEELKAAIVALRDAEGIFAFLRRDVRAARRVHRRLSRKRQKLTSRACAEHLSALLNFLQARARFDTNTGYTELLGNLFSGLNTDLEKAQRLVDWCAESSQQLAQAGDLRFDFISASERVIAILAQTSEQTFQFKKALDAAAANVAAQLGDRWLADVAGSGQDWRAVANEALNAAQACEKACATLLQVGPGSLPPEAIVSALEARVDLIRACNEIASDWQAQRLLGHFFAGPNTELEPLEETWKWGQVVKNAGLAEAVQRYLNNRELRGRLRDLGEKLENMLLEWGRLVGLPKSLEPYGRLWPEKWLRIEGGEAETAIRHAQCAQRLLEHMNELLPWVQYLAVRKRAGAAGLGEFVRMVEERRIPSARLAEAFECVFYATIARSLSRTHSELAEFSTSAHEQMRAEFCRIDNELKELNGKRLAHLLAQRDVPAGTSGPSPKDLSGRQLLIHEIAKRKRHLAIRQLIARAAGAIQALKPCWMMSPLSVAHYLQPGAVHFDLVVMDEASQIRPEEALGAIARAAQIVVVGDPNQLPPTSFFERSIEAADDDEGEEELGSAFSGTLSILEVANQFYPTRKLMWHYRSHHQSLIDFSNTQFYDGRLIVFPSPKDRTPELGVSYHHVEGATYAARQNLKEASRVVDAALEHVARHPDLSLGITTLNLTQRNLIDELLEQRVKGNEGWAAYCARWRQEGSPFFVKNLENVQGDERDVIFVSTTFGQEPGASRVAQRFGPVGTAMGWRRLNVLFTRAKFALRVYTSLNPEDIIVDAHTRRGTAEFRNYLQYARDGKIVRENLSQREPDSDFELAVADILRAHDYEVVPQLGVAGFFIDIAVRNPHRRGEFLAGIECDGATYHSAATVRDRDRLREQILEDLGWKGKIYRIWSTDWFRNRAHEARKLLQFLDTRRAQVPEIPPPPPPATPREEPAMLATVSAQAEPSEQLPLLVEEATDEERYVGVGDIVTYEDSMTPGTQIVVRIVERETDGSVGEVNENAPLARALLDLTVGDENELRIPGKPVRKVRVVRVEAPKSRAVS